MDYPSHACALSLFLKSPTNVILQIYNIKFNVDMNFATPNMISVCFVSD